MLSRCFLDFSVGVGAFVIGLSQISSFSLRYTFKCHFYKDCKLVKLFFFCKLLVLDVNIFCL